MQGWPLPILARPCLSGPSCSPGPVMGLRVATLILGRGSFVLLGHWVGLTLTLDLRSEIIRTPGTPTELEVPHILSGVR